MDIPHSAVAAQHVLHPPAKTRAQGATEQTLLATRTHRQPTGAGLHARPARHCYWQAQKAAPAQGALTGQLAAQVPQPSAWARCT